MATPKETEKKVDRAFEVIDRLEKSEKRPGSASKANPGHRPRLSSKSGLRINLSLDALISENDSRTEKELHPGKSNLLDIHLTVPYVWKIPIFGKTALKIIKRLQAQEYPESIRDILDSFRRKKPL